MSNVIEDAVGYLRVSTNMQDHERQRDELTIYGNKFNFRFVRFFEDIHTGSDYEKREGFQELLQFLKNNSRIKIVIFDEISRMGRDTAEQLLTYKELSRIGVRIFTRGKGEFGENKEDHLLFTVLSAIAEFEKQTMIDRTSSGRRKVVRDGYTQISVKPYGYNLLLTQKKHTKVLKRQFVEINKEEASIIETIFRMIDEGKTTYAVIRYLAENNIKSPKGNKKWGHSTIIKMLRNTMYYGKWQFGKNYKDHRTRYSMSKRKEEDTIYVDVPMIISKELFNSVQVKLAENKTKFNPKNQKDIYLLKGIGKCQCGRALQGYREYRSQMKIYRCPQRNIRGVITKTCPICSIKSDFIEKVLLIELKKKIEHPEFFRDLKINDLQHYQSQFTRLESRRKILSCKIDKEKQMVRTCYEKATRLEKLNKKKSQIFESLADNNLNKIEAMNDELEKLDFEIKNSQRSTADLNIFKDIKRGLEFITSKEVEEFDKSNQDEKLVFFRKYVREVRFKYLDDETVELRKVVQNLRKKGLYRKENSHLKKIYFICFSKCHELKQGATYVIGLEVEFVNNFVIEIQLPYFHHNPELAMSYILDGKLQLTPEVA